MRNAVIVTILLLAAGCGSKTGQPTAAAPGVKGTSVVIADNSPQLAAFKVEAAQPGKPVVHTLTGRMVWDEDRTVRVF